MHCSAHSLAAYREKSLTLCQHTGHSLHAGSCSKKDQSKFKKPWIKYDAVLENSPFANRNLLHCDLSHVISLAITESTAKQWYLSAVADPAYAFNSFKNPGMDSLNSPLTYRTRLHDKKTASEPDLLIED